MRERWFGATGVGAGDRGRGEDAAPVDEALVLEDVTDVSRLEGSTRGSPVVVRAHAEAVQAALARPEVACVLVPPEKRELLELDFRRLKYG